jgi:hypothetical protein
MSDKMDRYEIHHRLEELQVLKYRIQRLEEDELKPRGIKVFDAGMDLNFHDDAKFVSKWKDIYWRSIAPPSDKELDTITKEELAEVLRRMNCVYERWDEIYGQQVRKFKIVKLSKKRRRNKK